MWLRIRADMIRMGWTSDTVCTSTPLSLSSAWIFSLSATTLTEKKTPVWRTCLFEHNCKCVHLDLEFRFLSLSHLSNHQTCCMINHQCFVYFGQQHLVWSQWKTFCLEDLSLQEQEIPGWRNKEICFFFKRRMSHLKKIYIGYRRGQL